MAVPEENQRAEYHYIPGFGSLADFIAADGDHSVAIYRRFDRLAARDLLYYQSELSRLQAIQDEYDVEDAKGVERSEQADSWHHIRCNARDWNTLRHAAEKSPSAAAPPNASSIEDGARKRVELAMEIRKTLKDYREALIQENTLLSMHHPSQQTMTALSNYFHTRTTMADARSSTYPMLSGASSQLYPPGMSSYQIDQSDYVSLSQSYGSDLLTHFLKTYCARLFRVRPPSPVLPQHEGVTISHLPRSQATHYSIQRVRFVASFITTLTAAILLFLPIYTLYHTAAATPALTLGLIALFTILFAGAIVVMTQARRAEVFGACAGYAAVLVVFVSGDFVGSSGGG